ncbi:PBP1A family penicillin-binding protein [Stappia stellulata]|uniref:transglycosylase domain-containing protein n=1 Tax=Stappia stellulata TaxID=71235 RepID=UPI001CD68FC3|nr:PBP1A family penicillin-binding protein [Stappia stellulata]MCA1244589.1 PBP1A family penicillin-binding protein [Stappia stellulata]
MNKGSAPPDGTEPDTPKAQGGARPKGGRLKAGLLSADAWVDTALWRLGSGLRGAIEGYSAWLRRFRVRGPGRVAAELASDGVTFGVLGLVVMLALAQDAIDKTARADWRTTEDFSVTFLDRFGNEIGHRGILLNDTVPLEEIPDHMIKAALATEDRRFFHHFGIDVVGTFRAMMENVRARTVVQGGSSLTQQLAKNLFLSNERTLERKINEAFLALWLEMNLSKREILKLYLDRAYMGGGTFGVAAASEFYFAKNVRELSLAEAAMLAGLFKAPSKYAPHINLPAARARANEVLTNMVQAGFMTEGQVIGARRNPAVAVDRSRERSPDHFLDYAYDRLKELAREYPALANDRILTVRTSLDPGLQRQAERAILDTLRQHGNRYRVEEGAVTVIVPETGAVRAMVGGKDYGASQFNRAVDALRQPGSSFKPFVYITAFMNGYSPASVVPDAPINIGGWSPRNYGRSYRGPVTLKLALTKSINTIPVRLSQALGRDKVVENAHAMGINTELKITRALPLGVAEVTVLDMSAAYGSFASGGLKVVPTPILEVKNSAGETVYELSRHRRPPERLFPPEKAAEMNDVLVNVVEAGTGRRAQVPGVTAAGKTGTTQAYRDAWFVGYTGNYAAAVWFGNDDFSTTARMTGGSLPAMAWQSIMEYAHKGIELKPMPGVDRPPQPAEALVADGGAGSAAGRPRLLREQSIAVLEEIGARLDAIGKRADLPGGAPAAREDGVESITQ